MSIEMRAVDTDELKVKGLSPPCVSDANKTESAHHGELLPQCKQAIRQRLTALEG